ncbi:Cofactor assembly of complex c subunit b ccb1 protein [Thalictrum thalictroides]|uniref:Cofactor assembly of complex c subunit b ccb1 protein n=1 Tax=Thalictrum thalictroides TaxID=46969 RepID=A0A7J6WDZ0_THATH|nr:Cofactor assembly of complex c subunit b ccb1 protein [Thalictrum thalictroides]
MLMAATKLLFPHPHSLPNQFKTNGNVDRDYCFHNQPWLFSPSTTKRLPSSKRLLGVRFSLLQEPLLLSSTSSVNLHDDFNSLYYVAESVGYSLASYYTSLGLFVISVPGLWSLIKRSVKSKIVKKTFVLEEGEAKKEAKQVAGEILSFFTRTNFAVSDRGETITFEGMMVPSRGQAALLTFCTCISLVSVALVLTITVPDVGDKWYWLTILSPLAGVYYWKRASRKEQIKVKMVVEDEGVQEIIVQGDDQQVEQMRKELKLNEKGMVYVKGLFERE